MKKVYLYTDLLFLLILASAHSLFAQNFWQQTNGPYGGTIQAFAINPTTQHIFAGTQGGGVFRSMTNGDSWTVVNTDLTNTDVRALTINPTTRDIFAGTHGGGVLRSTNNGESWTAVNTGLTNTSDFATSVFALVINSSGHIFAGTPGGGAFRSTNNGDSWTAVNTGLTNIRVRALAINSSGHILAGTYGGGVFRSTNNGDSWTAVNTGLTNAVVRALAINSSGHIFAGTDGGVFRSTNNGDSWMSVNTGLANTYNGVLAINSSGHIFVAVAFGGVFRSTNNGDSWAAVNTGLTYTYVFVLAINSNGHIFAGTKGGVFRSTNNGDSWAEVNTDLKSTGVYALAINSSGHIFAGAPAGVFRSTNNGNSWAAVNTDMTSADVTALVVNSSSGHIFAGTNDGGVFRSTNNGDSWTAVNTGLTYTSVFALAINSSGHIFAGTPVGGVFRSTNNGDSWTAVNTGLTSAGVYALAINSSDHIFAGSPSGGVFRSTNNGDSWTAVNTGLTYTSVFALAINASGYIFAGTYGGGVFRSTNNGDSWTAVNTGLTNIRVRALAINSSGHILAGTNGGGVFRSTNNGDSWTAGNTGLTNTDIQSLVINNASGQLFAGTYGSGVFRSVQSTLVPVATSNPATNVIATSATFNGTVNPNSLSTTTQFDYGTTTSYGSVVTATPNPVTGTNSVAVSAALNGLAPNTTYHYRLVATNSAGTINGDDQAFSTGAVPIATTSTATNLGFTSATLNGAVNANRLTTTITFDYGTSTSYDNTVNAAPNTVTGTDVVPVNAALSGLSPNTTFHYRVVATNSAGTTTGADQTFMTGTSAPTVTTNAATAVSTTSATLNGAANPNNSSTALKFQYGTTTSYGNEIPATPGSVNGAVAVSATAQLTGLAQNTTYHYRIVATNSAGTTNGADQAFSTSLTAPAVVINAATNLTVASATLNGTVNPFNFSTTVKFEYGLNTNYGNEIAATPTPVTGANPVAVSAALSNLSPNTIYHFRIVAINSAGTTTSSDQALTTSPSAPALVTEAAINIDTKSATLRGMVNPFGLSATIKFDYGATTSYGNEITAPSLVTGNSMAPVSVQLSDLSPNTVYHFRIVATNNAGTTTGPEAAFATSPSAPAATTETATSIDATSVVLNGMVNPFNLNTTIKFEYGATTSYGSEIVATPGSLSGSNQVLISAQPQNLSPLNLYHYRVIANNSAGTTTGADRTFNTLRLNQPPVMAHNPVASTNKEQDITVVANITDDTRITNAILSYRRGGDKDFVSAFMSELGGFYQSRIPAGQVTARGVEYFLEATDLDGATTRAPAKGFSSIYVKVGEPGLIKEQAEPSGSEQTAYRLISVPLDLDNKTPRAVLEDDLGPYDNTQWRFYGVGEDQRKVEFPNTAEMTPGKGFWLIVKDAGKRISTGAGKSNLTSRPFAIALHPRWNLVGTPFNFSIPSSKLTLKSTGQAPELRSYTGSWNNPATENVTEILPFQGYAVFNSLATADTLFINPDLSVGGGFFEVFNTQPLKGLLQNSWSIQILAQCQQARDIDNLAAVSANASDAHDEMDRPEPPVIGEYVSVYFPHPEWKTLSENYCTDIRPKTSDGGLWTFEVKTNIRDVAQLSFDGLDSVPPEFEVWLVDEVLKISHNLREKNYYSVAGTEHPKRLKLVVGKRDFIDKQLATVQAIPSNYELSQNFPNPISANGIFDNPVTTIRYGLPREERVTLKVHDLLGHEVVTLINNELKNAGYHAAIWDGRNAAGNTVASGVYFIRIRAGSFVQTRKMALVE